MIYEINIDVLIKKTMGKHMPKQKGIPNTLFVYNS